jgi:hypothetical protein
MDDDSYATMGDDYKIIEDDNRRTHSYFFSSKEMGSEMVIKKEEIDYSDISGDPKDMKQIRRTRIANSDDEVNGNINRNKKEECSGSSCTLKPVRNVDYTICPICEKKYSQTCSCENHDSICPSGHKWHVRNNIIKIGHTH